MVGGPSSSPLHHRTLQLAEAAGANASTRAKEERETAISRLSDSKFSIKSYPDPLLRREKSKVYPTGVTPVMEQRWLEMIEESKN